jgi:hypothetical protein
MGRFYFYANPMDSFKLWLLRNTFTGCSSIQVIQQRKYDSETKTTTWLQEFLLCAEENQIIGSLWLDYKPTRTIERFFKIKLT